MNRRIVLTAIGIGALLIAVSVIALVFLAPDPPDSGKKRSGSVKVERVGEEALRAVRQLFQMGADVEGGRSVVNLLNHYADGLPADLKPRSIAPEEAQFLRDTCYLQPGELAEIANPSFTLLDAHYLEQVSLVHDAIRSLRLEGLAPLEQAKTAFDWLMREIKQKDVGDLPDPPTFVLRRGWGSWLERAIVFVALVDQLGLDSCILALPPGASGLETSRYWLVGVLVGEEVYLFDTRMGLPLPATANGGVATLKSILSSTGSPPILAMKNSSDKQLAYDVTAAQAKQAEVHVAIGLSCLAPRMEFLQRSLADADRLIFATDVRKRVARIEKAAQEAGCKPDRLRVWNLPGDPATPVRVLQGFLPPSEGGIDGTRARQPNAKGQLVPMQLFPPQIRGLPGSLAASFISLYQTPFVTFFTEQRVSKEVLQTWLPGLFESRNGEEQNKLPEAIQRGRMPRDLMLRGRFDEATGALFVIREELERQRNYTKIPRIRDDVDTWCQQAVSAVADLLRAQRGDPGTNLAAAQQAMQALSNESRKVNGLVLASAAEPMLAEVVYLFALTKHEQAVRAQLRLDRRAQDGRPLPSAEIGATRDAWRTAANWWSTYLEGRTMTPDSGLARFWLAQAKLNLGEREQAIQLLEDSSDALPPLERVGRFILASQISVELKK